MNRAELMGVLKKVMSGVEDKNTLLEGANSFMFDDEWIKTFNDEISVSYPFKSGIKCLVKAQEFFRVLSRINSDEIKMILLDDGKVQMSGGKTVLKMVSSDSSSILSLVDNLALGDVKWHKLPKDFVSALSIVSGFATTNTAMTPLCGVSIARDGLAASDRMKAGFYPLEFRSLKGDLVLPIGSVKELIKFVDLEEFSVGESWVHFKAKSGLQFSVRKLNADFPRDAIKNFLNFDETDEKQYVFPSGLLESIERASVMSFATQEGSEYVELSLDAKGNMIVSGAKQYGELKDKIVKDAKWSFPEDVTLKVQPAHFAALLALGNQFYLKDNKYILMKSATFECILALIIATKD